MPLEHLVIYFIAIWRIANLFVNEAGPWKVFLRIREWAGIKHDDTGFPYMIPDNFTAQLLSCIWCFSIWVSFFVTAVWLVSPEWSLKLCVPFALSGGAICIELVRVHFRT